MSDQTGGRNIAEYDWCDTFITNCTCRCESCTCTPVDGIVYDCPCDTDCDCCSPLLHAPGNPADWDDWDGDPVDSTALCGVGFRQTIPGLFSRMGARRCPDCCDRLGYPHGVGSPKNDPECRRILGMDSGEQR